MITWTEQFGQPALTIDLRVDGALWHEVTNWVYDFRRGEQAGVLLVRPGALGSPSSIIAEQFLPVPDQYIVDRAHGLRYDGRFNLRVAELADRLQCGAVLIHAHPDEAPPRPSPPDATYGAHFLAFMRRRRPDDTHGLLVIGNETATGICESANERRSIRRVVAAGIPLVTLPNRRPPDAQTADLRDRQLLAIGAAGQTALAASTIAVVGISGGGSHVVQQLIHAGVGTLIAIDSDIVDERNIRRLVGAVRTDIDRTKKIDIPGRIARAVRPEVNVVPIDGEFPSTETIGALSAADIIIGCVDGWDVRDALNDFSLQQRVPYIDIGASIAPPTAELAMRVGGQIVIVTPDGPCMCCMGLITNARVEASRARHQGYMDGVDEPQVVSVNGTLASEAVTAAIMLVAGDSRLERYRRFAYPPGKLTVVEVKRRAECPACRQARLRLEFER